MKSTFTVFQNDVQFSLYYHYMIHGNGRLASYCTGVPARFPQIIPQILVGHYTRCIVRATL